MNGREIYRTLCEASNLDAAVAELSAKDLTAVAEYVAGLKQGGGLPAQVWGVIQQAMNPKKKIG
jgi:hypothetical protein